MSLHLTKSELELIQSDSVGPLLVHAWGYRTGINYTHEKFEKESHQGGLWRELQRYTDILFRNIQQLCYYEGFTHLLYSDTFNIQRSLENFENYVNTDGVVLSNISNFLKRFLEGENVDTAINRILTSPVKSKDFEFIQKAARSICFLANSQWAEAYDELKNIEDIEGNSSDNGDEINYLYNRVRYIESFLQSLHTDVKRI